MEPRDWTVGARVEHPVHGPGTVTSVGTDYLGIAFDASGEALIRREAFKQPAEAPEVTEPMPFHREILPWPESTFVAEPADTPHYLGSHWDPFADGSEEVMRRLPAILPHALVQTGYGEACKPSREAPQDWAQGFQLVWPLRAQGLALTVRAEQQANAIVSIFPFIAHGSQQTLTLREVTVRTASRRQRHRVQAGLAGPADDGVSRRAFRVGGRTGARRRARASGVRSGLRPGLARHARQTLLRRRESRRGALSARQEAFQ